MSTSYNKIYANLLPKFQSYDIPLMTENEVKDLLHDFFIPAITRFHTCRKDLTDRNDTIEEFNADLSDNEIEILSNFMLLEYIDSEYVRTPTLLKVSLPSTDFHAFSSANMLDKLLAMQERYLNENEGLLSRYSWMGAKESGILSQISAGYKKKEI